MFLDDHSVIRPDVFGRDSAGLHCLTSYQSCCGDILTGQGQWITPNGNNVGFQFNDPSFYMTRNPSRVSLNRDSLTPATGIYRCLIPVSENSDQTIHIGLYPEGQGELYACVTN